MYVSLRPRGLQPTRLLSPRNSPGKNTGVGSHFLPQNKLRVTFKCSCFRESVTPIQAIMLLSEGFLPFSRGSSTQNHQSQSLAAEICLFGLWYGGSEVKASACNAGDPGLIPGLERSPGEGNGNPLQYSCLVNPMDRGAW